MASIRIEHIALWTRDLERSRAFYETYFGGISNEKYFNPNHQFESYFLTFEDSPRLELMQMPNLSDTNPEPMMGWAHIAFSVGSKPTVDDLTQRLQADGFTIASAPRTTGDGYYESVVLDPDGNRVEITI